jgi:uridine phosphorylase
VTICSTGIGGPSTAIAMEELINLGAHTFIRVGSCGGCQKNIRIGDVIISDSVIREDHTCLDYVPLQFPGVANRYVLRALEDSAVKAKARHHVGPSISSDALYSKANKERKIIWSQFGALAQDMETGTVLTLARVKGVSAGSILLVVDAEGEKNIKEKIARYSSEARSGAGQLVEMEKKAVKIALDALLTLGKK